VKSNPQRTWLLFGLLLVTIFLVACERPLQPEADLERETPSLEETPGLPPAQATPALITPMVTPSAAVATPGAGGEESGEGGATQPPEAGATEESTQPPATEQPREDVIHTVVAGDTLGKLADQYGVTIEAIAAANNLVDINTLEVGQQLLIPLSGNIPEPTPGGEGGQEQIYIVRAGDTLFRIGQSFGFTVDELVAYNNITDPNRLEIGQEIKIPPEGYTIDQ
jgi:LysM repeat protein